MKNIFIGLLLTILMIFINIALAQDNIYGDYLIAAAQKTISLDLEGAQLIDVLKMLSQQTGLNFVSNEIVQDRALTLYMDKVPLKQAMDIIFKANNLAYDYYPDANIFVVKDMGRPFLELMTKVFKLKYARLSSSKLQTAIGTTSSTIKDSLLNALTTSGKIAEDPFSNSLIITDIPVRFPVIEELLEKLDVPPPQVMIEVEMLDVSRRLVDNLGMNFPNGFIASFSPDMSNFNLHGPLNMKHLTLSGVSLSSFSATLKLLKTDTTTKFLARPKILTLANETAEVNLTVDEVTGLKVTTSGETATTSTEVERAETGTSLKVTPQVNPVTKEITLYVEVTNKEAKDSGLSITQLQGGNLKNIEERGTKSVIRLKDGDTLLLGGLIRKNKEEIVRKVPFFADIPILGAAFRYRTNDTSDRELVVFLTPRIVGGLPTTPSPLARSQDTLTREQSYTIKQGAIKIALDKFSR